MTEKRFLGLFAPFLEVSGGSIGENAFGRNDTNNTSGYRMCKTTATFIVAFFYIGFEKYPLYIAARYF